MKPFVILFLAVVFFSFERKPGNVKFSYPAPYKHFSTTDTSKLRFNNSSSLKRLPSILHDLSIALNESIFQREGLLNENGFTVNLNDVFCKNFDTSATVMYLPGDTVYHIKLNHFNRYATDRALAATLIHEIMHCVLMDIDRRARRGDEKTLFIIEIFNQKIRNPFVHSVNNFFDLMNKGDAGQHELMCQLFYEDMVLLLERFSQIHKSAFWHHEDAESLVWSGLQGTTVYKKLGFEEQRQIEFTIMREKGIPVSLLDY